MMRMASIVMAVRVAIRVDATKPTGELRPKSVYFRTHNLRTSGDGTLGLK